MSSSAAETVANVDDLLKKILERAPALSLIRFKCVSKHWLSLISDPGFRRHHTLLNPNPKISAFFNPISPVWNPFKTLPKFRVLQSCNGLLLCHVPVSLSEQTKHYPVYVVNPTTNQFRSVSCPYAVRDISGFVRYALAFDPSKSPHFNVVCVTNRAMHHKINVFSSETGEWKFLETPFFRVEKRRNNAENANALYFDEGSSRGAVYCNGAVHWIRHGDEPVCHVRRDGRLQFVRNEPDVLHYFEISQERLLVASAVCPVSSVVKSIRMEGDRPATWPKLNQRYFGECGGSLYKIEIYKHCMTQFDLMEMERDYSGWFVKYSVDLNPLVAALSGQEWIRVLCLSQAEEIIQRTGDEVDGSSIHLFLYIPGMVISYNLRNQTFRVSVELANKELFLSRNLQIGEDQTFPFMETLVCLWE